MKTKRKIIYPFFILVMLLFHQSCAEHPTELIKNGLPILPGVSGYGLETKGGADGKIIKVSNLNKEGKGSLAEALQQSEPRIVVFEVAGVIDLNGQSLRITNPYLTVAGQTAPYPGITLIKGGVRIQTHDVIIQHIKVRPGEAGNKKKSGWEVDGLATSSGAYNVIVDHCSFTWASDENLSASGPRFSGDNVDEWRKNTSHKIVFSNCIIAEGLSNSTHAKGEHSKGTLIHDNACEILIVGNLYASNMRRNPFCKGGSQVTILNNFISNPGSAAIHYNLAKSEWGQNEWVTGKMVVEGNYIETGNDTRKTLKAGAFNGPVEVYWKNNYLDGTNSSDFSGTFIPLDEAPFWPQGFNILPANTVKEMVLENAGAFPWQRDDIDIRIISEARNGTGTIIDSEEEVGGYPVVEPVYREFKVDEWDLTTMSKK